MPRSASATRAFLLDTNLFVAAIRHPRKETATLRLLLRILEREDLALVGHEIWAEELVRYAEAFRSETATWLLAALLRRARIVPIRENFVKVCRAYITTPDLADVLHAAACLQEHAILVTNDKHFDGIRDEGILEVWSISRAMEEILG